jgi:CRP-like cAMP-binding protein
MPRAIRPEKLLASLPLFQGLEADALLRLAEGTTRRPLVRGEILFREGEPATGLHAVVYGRIKLFHLGSDGRERVIDIVGGGRTFGEPVMFLEKPYLVSASALADTLLLHVAKETVFAELQRNPRFAARIIGTLAQRTEALVRELQDYAIGTGSRRFVGWLLRQRGAAAASGTAVVTLPAAKRVLAARLKVSAEHLSRILRELAAAGLIAVRGREVTIPDLARLRAWQLDGG